MSCLVCGVEIKEEYKCVECQYATYCSEQCRNEDVHEHKGDCKKQRYGRIFFEEYLMRNERVFTETIGRCLGEYEINKANSYMLVVWREKGTYFVKKQEAVLEPDLEEGHLAFDILYVHTRASEESTVYTDMDVVFSVEELQKLIKTELPENEPTSLQKQWVLNFV